MPEIILASTSIYRQQQLERLNIPFSTASPDVDEDALKSVGLDPLQLSKELSVLKASNISVSRDDAIVIGGDQVASFGNAILSKPKTRAKAFKQLRQLAGERHQLLTSLAIIANGQQYVHTCIATMKMRQLTDEQIRRYIEIDEPLHSCGSYRIEALGISLFERIDCEDHTAIMGIPLLWTVNQLAALGLAIP